MKSKLIILAIIAAASLMAAVAMAQTDPGNGNGNGVCGFVDENGDGFNDLAPDADGDGIPNGLDPDYVKPADGTGQHHGGQTGQANQWDRYARLMRQFAGEGMMVRSQGEGGHAGQSFGPGAGAGIGPADGTGFGPGDGTGECTGDGTPASSRNGRRGGTR